MEYEARQTLNELVESEAGEGEIQDYLEKHDWILKASIANPFWSYNIVFPQFRLGSDGGIPDFLILSGQSYSYEIHVVELKLASLKIFNRDCSLNSNINKAVVQLQKYEDWIEDNLQYFKRILFNESVKVCNDFNDDFNHSKRFHICLNIIAGRREKSNLDKSSAMRGVCAEIISYDRLIEVEKRWKEMEDKKIPFHHFCSDFLISSQFDGCEIKSKVAKG